MSTSDAGELELRVVGERATIQSRIARTATASFTEAQQVKPEDNCCQFIRQISPPETDSECPLPVTIPFLAVREDEVPTVFCNELKTNRDLWVNQHLSHSGFGLHKHNGLHILPCRTQPKRTVSGSVESEENIKDHTKFKDQKDPLEELSNPAVTMLSSTVVTVLAPNWSGRVQRTKRFEETGNSVFLGSLQDVKRAASNHAHEHFQETPHGVETGLIDGSQARLRVPVMGARRNTVDWSVQSGPARLESKRKMTVSLDANSGRMDNKKQDAGNLSPVATTASPLSPLCFDPNDQRRNSQIDPQGALSALSSKPTTSSLLLSLRRINSSGRSSNVASTLSKENPSPSNREGNLFTTHLSQTFPNNIEQQRPMSHLCPPSISCRTTEIKSVLSPSTSNHRERNISESHFFSHSPTTKETEDKSSTQHPQTGPKLTFLSRGPSVRQQDCKNINLSPKSLASSPRHSPYDPSALLKTQPLLRGSTLTSTSWWKQVTPEDNSPLTPNDPFNHQVNTLCTDNIDLTGPTTNIRINSQIPNNRDDNNTTESICKDNTNIMKTWGGTHNLKQRNAEDSPDHKSDRTVKQQCGSNLNIQQPQKSYHLPTDLSLSKISKATAPTTLSHPKDLSKHDVSNSSNVTESPPTLQNPKISNIPTESSRKHNNHCSSKTNSILASPHNKDEKPLTSKASSALPLIPNTTTSSSLHSHSVFSQTIPPVSLNTGCSSQTPKFTITANAMPLGFERSYGSKPKPFQPKTVSNLIPTASAFSKTNYSPLSISPTTCSSLPTPPSTPIITSSPTTTSLPPLLTPPATPNITSPMYSKNSSPKQGRTFSSSPERDPKKLCPRVEGKKVRRVTWGDSVDLKHSETITVEEPQPSGAPTNPLFPKSPRSVLSPSIFSFLRPNSPTTNSSPLCSHTPKTTSIQVGKRGKYRSLSSDTADLISREQEKSKHRSCDTAISDQGRWDLTTPRQEQILSVESDTAQCSSSAPLFSSSPPDFISTYKLRYSSTPYCTLMSSRSTQGETKTLTPRSPLFQQTSSSIYSPHLSSHSDPCASVTIPASKSPPLPLSPPQTSKCGVSKMDQVNNNNSKSSRHDNQNGQILFVNNRFHISSESLQGDKVHSSSSTCVTETLVYSIKSKVDKATNVLKNTTPKPLQHNANTVISVETKSSQQPHTVQSKETSGEPYSQSDQCSSSSSSAESQFQDDEGCTRRVKDSVLGKGRFLSVESSSEQSPKRSRFALKRSVSTPNSTLSRSDSEKANKPNNKMDQVLNRLRQTFSTRRTDDDLSFPWKWKRSPQIPSASGSSDISDVKADSTKTMEEQEQEGVVVKDKKKVTKGMNTWTQNRCTIIPPSVVGSTVAGDQFFPWSDKSSPKTDQVEQEACARHKSESETQVHLTAHSPTMHQFDSWTDYKTTNQYPPFRDPSPGRSPNLTSDYPSQFRRCTSNPRSPFSPFPSLSPLSPISTPDTTDDNVFYSPKLQRRRESSSPCDPGEEISLMASRRSKVYRAPSSVGPGQDKDHLTSSYADLKYGIEPGRSFSVSSVLSSRPSGPGRISTGSRFMSVGDLSESSLTCRHTGKDWDQWAFTPDWTSLEYGCQPPSDCHIQYFPNDPGKMRSRSLPRSLTRRLADWSSGLSVSQPVTTTVSKPTHLWTPNMNTCHFEWDTEGPPTPPPTPPLSPLSRRLSKPPSLSSPTFPSSPGAPQSTDSQSPRGHLPSRGYISSLSTFEESSDSSSDTTTDDEYYLETGEDEEKETEL